MKTLILLSLLFLSLINAFHEEWAIEFKGSDTELHDFITYMKTEYGAHYKGPLHVLPQVHSFNFGGLKKRDLDEKYTRFEKYIYSKKRQVYHDKIVWFEPQILKKREKRYNIVDPLYIDQWHLHDTSAFMKFHINSNAAWDLGYLGNNVTIAIVDDGIETTHPDIISNYKPDGSINLNTGSLNPNPTYYYGAAGDWHGTASAGAAAARDDGNSCGVGVAPRASLSGIAILQNNAEIGDTGEANALSYKNNINQIYSNSWGPLQPGLPGQKMQSFGTLARRAVEQSIKSGRNGLGSIYVWAAGNDKRSGDNSNYDGYANSRYTICVGSTDEYGKETYYSEPGANLHVVAPGGSGNGNGFIRTTDLKGVAGRSTDDCMTNIFAGTSASCPMVAGFIALILEVNPNLTWLDVQYIVVNSTIKNDPDDEDWVKNGAGYWVNHKFGFGLIDCGKAVTNAKNYNQTIVERQLNYQSLETTDIDEKSGNKFVGTSIMHVREGFEIHHVELVVITTHPDVKDTTIILTSPQKTVSILATQHNDMNSKWDGWVLTSNRYWGEISSGRWNISVYDESGKYKILSWDLRIYGKGNISFVEDDSYTLISTTQAIDELSNDKVILGFIVVLLVLMISLTVASIVIFIFKNDCECK